MKITIYELLGMIKDDKVPKKIRIFDGTLFEYYEPSRHYYTKDKKSLLKILDEYRGDVFNTKVEIIEEKEENKIIENLIELRKSLENELNDIKYTWKIDLRCEEMPIIYYRLEAQIELIDIIIKSLNKEN